MKTRTGFKYAGFRVLGIAAVFGFTLVVMWLWNWLVPDLFNGPELRYTQTLGLLVLSKILFSGIGGGSWDRYRQRRHREYFDPEFPKSKWRQKYEARMNGKVEPREGQAEGEIE